MHTIMVLLAGFALLAIMAILGRRSGKPFSQLLPAFLLLWLLCSLVNMWVGMSSAGYTFMQELPMLVIVFGVPAIAAIVLSRKS